MRNNFRLSLFRFPVQVTSAKLVNIVHDEVIVEGDAGEEYVKKVPVKVDAHVADEWTK